VCVSIHPRMVLKEKQRHHSFKIVFLHLSVSLTMRTDDGKKDDKDIRECFAAAAAAAAAQNCFTFRSYRLVGAVFFVEILTGEKKRRKTLLFFLLRRLYTHKFI